jgi:hypothetical protein
MRAITATATPAAPTQLVCLDQWFCALCGVQVIPSGGATFTVDYSFDNPNDLIAPIPLGAMSFDTSMCPAAAINGTVGLSFVLPASPVWARVRLLNGAGSVRATWLQIGQRSYVSKINPPTPPPAGASLDFSQAGNSQYLGIPGVG